MVGIEARFQVDEERVRVKTPRLWLLTLTGDVYVSRRRERLSTVQ